MLNKSKFETHLPPDDAEGKHNIKKLDRYIYLFRAIANRQKRTTDYLVLLTSRITYPVTCISTSCRTAFFDSIRQRCSDITNIFLQLQIDNRLIDFVLHFISFTLAGMTNNQKLI